MTDPQTLVKDVLANGKVDGEEIKVLRQELYAAGRPDRRGMDALVEIHKRVQRVTPAFEQFFYQALKDYLLRDGRVSAAEVAWLRGTVLTGTPGVMDAKFLRELRGEAKGGGPELEALCGEFLK